MWRQRPLTWWSVAFRACDAVDVARAAKCDENGKRLKPRHRESWCAYLDRLAFNAIAAAGGDRLLSTSRKLPSFADDVARLAHMLTMKDLKPADVEARGLTTALATLTSDGRAKVHLGKVTLTKVGRASQAKAGFAHAHRPMNPGPVAADSIDDDID